MIRRFSELTNSLEHGNKIICDYPWHIMILGSVGGTIDRIDDTLGRYRVHSNSFGAHTNRDSSRRLVVTDELVNACRLGQRFSVADSVIDEGISHVYYAAALYFLKRNQYELFHEMLAKSEQNGKVFDDRHAYCLRFRSEPERVKLFLELQK